MVLRANGYRFSTYTVPYDGDTKEPEWNTEFVIPLANWKKVPALSFIVWNKAGAQKSYVGEVIVRLPGLNVNSPDIQWCSLTNSQSDSKTPPGDIGIKFSLGSPFNNDDIQSVWTKFIDNFGGPEQSAAREKTRRSESSSTSTEDDSGDESLSKSYRMSMNPDNTSPASSSSEVFLTGIGSIIHPDELGLEDDLNGETEYDFDDDSDVIPDDEKDDTLKLFNEAGESDITSAESGYTDSAFNISETDLSGSASALPDKLSVVSLEDHLVPPGGKKKKLRRRRNRRRHHKHSPIYQVNMDSDVIGMTFMEIQAVNDLPPYRNMTRTNFDMDPFVVISFGKKTFRTPYRRHTLNPVFNEKLLFPVHKYEAGFSVNFSVLDKDRLTLNDFVADIELPVKDILQTAPIPNDLGIFDIDSPDYDASNVSSSGYKTFTLPLRLKKLDKYGEKYHPWITLKARFLPYAALRQRLWHGMIKVYDSDDTGGLNYIELSTMLDSLGSTLSEETRTGFFQRFGKNPDADELTTEEAVVCLEEQVIKDSTVDQIVPDNMQPHEGAERVLQVAVCPFCSQPRLSKKTEIDIVTHLATCATQNWAKFDALIMGRFVTSRQATKRWYSKIVSKVSYGNYRLGANSANILVQDRITGRIQEEKMSVYVRVGIRLLYKGLRSSHMEGKRIRNLLRALSIKQGRKFDSPDSVQSILPFIKFHKLNMEDVLEPLENFGTFNEFFYRKLKPEARPNEAPRTPGIAVSAADCRMTCFQTIKQAQDIWIKGRSFSVERLIGPVYPDLVQKYHDGSLAIFRLAPQDYHRFHSPVDGVLGEPKVIAGEYYTVNPMAIRSSLDVYGENVRVIVPIISDKFGVVTVCCIGAMMVGSTVITAQAGERIARTDELGYFKFGGSTLVIIFEPKRIVFDEDIKKNTASQLETLVRVGMSIGHAPEEKEARHDYEKLYSPSV